MSDAHDIPDADLDLIDRTLAGELSAEELSLFERRLSVEPGLRAEFARQEQLQGALRDAVKLPSSRLAGQQLRHAGETLAPFQQEQKVARNWHRRALLALAAMLLIGTASVTWWATSGPSASDGTTDPYTRLVAEGFRPALVETDARALEAVLAEKLGKRVQLPRRAGIEYLGLCPHVGGSPLSIGVAMKVDQKQVLLVLDRAGKTSTPWVGKAGGVVRHDAEAAGLRLMEWSESEPALMLGDVRVQ